jgi:hypothetical protein
VVVVVMPTVVDVVSVKVGVGFIIDVVSEVIVVSMVVEDVVSLHETVVSAFVKESVAVVVGAPMVVGAP